MRGVNKINNTDFKLFTQLMINRTGVIFRI